MSEAELVLRAHVRSQLHDYMNANINIDHIAYTEHLATQVGEQRLPFQAQARDRKPVVLIASSIHSKVPSQRASQRAALGLYNPCPT